MDLFDVISYFKSLIFQEIESISFSEDFKCPITWDLMIESIKTNCNHVFERLALSLSLSKSNLCPICRAIIISAIPDKILAEKVQDEFVKVDRINKRYFVKVKKELNKNPLYNHVRNTSIIPKETIQPNVHHHYLNSLSRNNISDNFISRNASLRNYLSRNDTSRRNVSRSETFRSITENKFLKFLKNIKIFFYFFSRKEFYDELFTPGRAPRHPVSAKIYYSGFYGFLRKVSQ